MRKGCHVIISEQITCKRFRITNQPPRGWNVWSPPGGHGRDAALSFLYPSKRVEWSNPTTEAMLWVTGQIQARFRQSPPERAPLSARNSMFSHRQTNAAMGATLCLSITALVKHATPKRAHETSKANTWKTLPFSTPALFPPVKGPCLTTTVMI